LEGGQAQTALGWYQKAIARLEPIVAQQPRQPDARLYLRDSHRGRARALDELGQHAEAARGWERALELADGPEKGLFRSGLAGSRLRGFANARDAAGCLAAAAEYETLKRTGAPALYNAACHRAIGAAVIREDLKTPKADAARLATEQADLAMAWL